MPRIQSLHSLRPAAILLFLVVFAPAALGAQEVDGGAASTAGRPNAEAVPADEALQLDGRLDESVWARARAITDFTQMDPDEGTPVSEPTEVRVVYGSDALYISARLHDSHEVSSRLGRRDDRLSDSDWFSVALDSYHDHRTAFRFRVNPAGIRGDAVITGGGGGGRGPGGRGDDSWDPVWHAATTVTDSGWVAEMRIPFSQLRFSEGENQTWGVQFTREIARNREEAVFAFTPKSERGGVARYGHLVGLRSVQSADPVELLPYVLSRAEYSGGVQADEASAANPFADGSAYSGAVGLDMKYGVTSNLTLDATVNPDFGQVEVDPAVVNLSAFETFFREKRPFFVEGADIFEFGSGGGGRWNPSAQLFYSRRIGRAPQMDIPDEAEYETVPDATTILGATKLSGRTSGGWSIGVLEAVTAAERARYVGEFDTEQEALVEPLTNYTVGRLQRQFREGRTVVGGAVTAVNRRMDAARTVAELRSSAYAGGIDFRHEWADRGWALSGHVAGSRIHGEPSVIEDAQRSSARYFQRPDADHLRLDPGATSLQGYTGRLELEKQSGLHWRGGVELNTISPGFEVNDLGFQSRADRIGLSGDFRYVENRPGDVFRNFTLSLDPRFRWNYDGKRMDHSLSFDAFGQLTSYWGGHVGWSHNFEGLDARLTRGGPLTIRPARDNVSFRLNSDRRKPWNINLNGNYNRDAAGGSRYSANVGLDLRPTSSWSISLGPRYEAESDPAQYVTTIDDPAATDTYGQRYIFADLDRTTVSMDLRLNVTFRPRLTLELYAQPLLASGDYGTFKQLSAPGTFDFDRYGDDLGTIGRDDDEFVVDPDGGGPASAFRVEDQDFNIGSLRGNAVLRWEWQPGSTIFFVWQQERSDDLGLGRLDLRRDARALVRTPPDNVFLLKVNYWLNP